MSYGFQVNPFTGRGVLQYPCGDLRQVAPATVAGWRALARAALWAADGMTLDELRETLDGMEMKIVLAMKIEPENEVGIGEEAELTGVWHGDSGLVLSWRITEVGDDCPACEGSGELIAHGMDGRDYDVTCPRCDWSEDPDREERFVYTDIDGRKLAA